MLAHLSFFYADSIPLLCKDEFDNLTTKNIAGLTSYVMLNHEC